MNSGFLLWYQAADRWIFATSSPAGHNIMITDVRPQGENEHNSSCQKCQGQTQCTLIHVYYWMFMLYLQMIDIFLFCCNSPTNFLPDPQPLTARWCLWRDCTTEEGSEIPCKRCQDPWAESHPWKRQASKPDEEKFVTFNVIVFFLINKLIARIGMQMSYLIYKQQISLIMAVKWEMIGKYSRFTSLLWKQKGKTWVVLIKCYLN